MSNILPQYNRCTVFSTPFTLVGVDECLQYIDGKNGEDFEYIVTPNVDHIIRINNNSGLHNIYDTAALSLCDSRVVRILASLCGIGIPVVITGSDLTRLMFEEVIKPENSLVVIGGESLSITKLSKIYNLHNIHHYNPPMGFIEDESEIIRCIEFLARHPSRFIFLTVGSPQQEILANRIYKSGTAVGIAFCVGASLNFLTGEEKRAPKFVQILALEWLFRLMQDPKRMWKRYLVDDIKIFPIFIKCLWKQLREKIVSNK